MKNIAIFPGSFDPLTKGHCDIIQRSAPFWDKLHVVVVHNPNKSSFFSLAERVNFLEEYIRNQSECSNVVIDVLENGLLSEYCLNKHASAIVRGLRSQTDITYEMPQAIVNRHLASVETLFFVSDPQHAVVSSSLVREVLRLGGDINPYVPASVAHFVSLHG